jgi:hypothetical protein
MHLTMVQAQLILQIVRIAIIVFDFVGIFAILSIKRYKSFWLWTIPILILLTNSAAFNVALLYDRVDGVVNPYIYNLWSEIIHMQDKMTIGIYITGILIQHLQTRIIFTGPIQKILNFLKGTNNGTSS